MEKKKDKGDFVSFKRQGRILSFQAIYSYFLNPINLDDLILFSWNKTIPPNVYKFAIKLTKMTIEREEEIVKILEKVMKDPLYSQISEIEKSILHISVCQLLYFKNISTSIIIDEAIELAKSYATAKSYRMINAVLDSVKKDLINSQ